MATATAQLKHRWSVGHNYLAGITAGDWWRLLRANGFAVDAVYWHRAAVVTALSAVNAVHRWRERRFDAAIAATPLAGPPLFVLGHWRSGTTHLHNLLAQDTIHFAYANTYQVINPHTFLTTEALNTRLFAGLLPATRPMDNVALSFESPHPEWLCGAGALACGAPFAMLWHLWVSDELTAEQKRNWWAGLGRSGAASLFASYFGPESRAASTARLTSEAAERVRESRSSRTKA